MFAYDGDLTAFCGAMSTRTETDASSAALYQRPRRLVRGENCSNSGGALFIPGAVLQHKLTLLPGEVKTLRFVFGISENSEEARRVAKQYTQEKKVEEALRAAEARDREKCSSLSVHTPDQKINHVMNIWLKKQVDFCIVGKKGVRDNLQIAVALLNYRPEKAKEEILECLRHQFRDGYAVLTWYPYDDTRYSDQPFWIIWAVCELVKETGDASILSQPIGWQDGGEATVLEHVKAAVDRLLQDRGRNGLVRIYFADWNDALNIPPEEEVESVMLSEQFCLALRENSLSAPFCFFRSNYNCNSSFVAFISAQIVRADTVRPHKFSKKRREQLSCPRLFFHSPVFDYIRCCNLDNIVENGRIFLPILANVVELCMIVAKE